MSSYLHHGGGGEAYDKREHPMHNLNASPPPPYPEAAAQTSALLTSMGMAPSGPDRYDWGNFAVSGLDLLRDQEVVNVVKLFNLEEAISFIDKARRFSVTNEDNMQMLSLVENEDFMDSNQNHRTFVIEAFDVTGAKVFTVAREDTSACSYCGFCCACFGKGCRTKVKVKINDRTIGSISSDCGFATPKFTIYRGDDYEGEELVNITGSTGPCCNPGCDYRFQYPRDSSPSGNFKKKGGPEGGFSNSYRLHFLSRSDPHLKALCIAAGVLIDFRCFHKPIPRRR